MSSLWVETQPRGAISPAPVTAGVQLLPNLGDEIWPPSHGPYLLLSSLPPVSRPPPFPNASARELELEDRQSRLQQELRERMAVEGKRGAGLGTTGESWVWACCLLALET